MKKYNNVGPKSHRLSLSELELKLTASDSKALSCYFISLGQENMLGFDNNKMFPVNCCYKYIVEFASLDACRVQIGNCELSCCVTCVRKWQHVWRTTRPRPPQELALNLLCE